MSDFFRGKRGEIRIPFSPSATADHAAVAPERRPCASWFLSFSTWEILPGFFCEDVSFLESPFLCPTGEFRSFIVA